MPKIVSEAFFTVRRRDKAMTNSHTKKTNGKKAALIAAASVLAFVILVLVGARAYFRLPVSRYYQASEKGFVIPGLKDGFVPQGLDFDDRSDCFFVTGYMDDGSASPIYLVQREQSDSVKTVWLAKESGEAFTGHAGGIAVKGDYIYIAGGADYCVYAYSYDAVMEAEDGSSVACVGAVSTGTKEDGTRVSALAVDDDYLYAAEFYREPQYPTHASYKMTTANGDYQQALAVAYALSDETDSVCGVDPAPAFCYSLPDQVQGMCFDDGKIYLSTSYGVSFSHIYVYDGNTDSAWKTEMTLQGETVPVYALDSGVLLNDIKLAPMSEEIVFADDRLYTMCESASDKYFFGKLTSAKWCYATDVEKY